MTVTFNLGQISPYICGVQQINSLTCEHYSGLGCRKIFGVITASVFGINISLPILYELINIGKMFKKL